MKQKTIKNILEYVWIGIVLLFGYYYLKDQSFWILFLVTFVLAGAGALSINFLFEGLAMRKKKKEQNK
ncbi:hypothetical protein [Bacillus manliponensis]|uniref:hypothetical protein n=1 Tax=Bacillus manliponensis TaxID=574376 RepID=UPI003515ABF0